MQVLILHVIPVKVLALAMKKHCNKQKYDAISGYYTLIMNRNLVDVAQQAVKDYQGHVENVQAQYNVGLVASSDVLAAKTNLADSETKPC